jgi:hypothetical protein
VGYLPIIESLFTMRMNSLQKKHILINFPQPPLMMIIEGETMDELLLYLLTILMVYVIMLMSYKTTSCLLKGDPKEKRNIHRLYKRGKH